MKCNAPFSIDLYSVRYAIANAPYVNHTNRWMEYRELH
jgi:hypothetical protein